jgi:hypothetical protein
MGFLRFVVLYGLELTSYCGGFIVVVGLFNSPLLEIVLD